MVSVQARWQRVGQIWLQSVGGQTRWLNGQGARQRWVVGALNLRCPARKTRKEIGNDFDSFVNTVSIYTQNQAVTGPDLVNKPRRKLDVGVIRSRPQNSTPTSNPNPT